MLSELPDGWRLSPLGQVARIETGKTPSTKQDEFWGGNIPFVTPSDLDGSLFVKNTDRSLTAAGAEKSKLIPAGSLVFTCIASIGKAAINEIDCVTNQQINACTFDSPEETLFYHYQLQHRLNDLMALAGQTAVAIINKGKFSAFSVVVPPLNEQHRIAEILSSVDASIQATQAVIEQAERVKRGLMEELLTGGLGSEAIERGEVPEGYEAKKLGDLLEGIDGGVSVNSQSEPASCKEKGILKTSCVSNSFFDASENKVVPDEKEIKRLREPVQAETIIFSRMNTPKLVGANAFVPVSHKNLFLPDRLWALKPVSKVMPRWLGFYMSYLFSNGVFEALGTGTSGSMKNISKSKLKEVSIAVPPEVEQARIAEILSGADDFIAKQKTTIEQQNRTKRGLMDDLLTGKVRTF